jgi:hypothetical protein
MEPTKHHSVRDWPVPSNTKELRSFLGLSGYYRKFVKNYGVLAKPLTNLLRKGVLFVWTAETERAFQLLKESLITAPVLSLPDFTKVFTVKTDASDIGIGAILLQENHPIAFVSKSLGPKTWGLSTYEKEYLAILLVIDQWRPYLQHAEFRIISGTSLGPALTHSLATQSIDKNARSSVHNCVSKRVRKHGSGCFVSLSSTDGYLDSNFISTSHLASRNHRRVQD